MTDPIPLATPSDLAESSLKAAMDLLGNPAPESCTLLVTNAEFHLGCEVAEALGIAHVVIHPCLLKGAWYVEDSRGKQAGSRGP